MLRNFVEAGFSPGSELADLPPRLEPFLELTKVTHFGKYITFASNPFANKMGYLHIVKNHLQQFANNHQDQQLLPSVLRPSYTNAIKLMKNLGVYDRWKSPPVTERSLEEVFEESAAAGALLIRRIMQEKGWRTIDFLKVGSASLPDLAEMVLKRAGISGHDVHISNDHVACADGVVQFIDALTNPELQGKNGIILNLNPLGYMEHPRHFDDQLGLGILFGDQNIAWGFNTRDFDILAAKITIVPDHGTISLKTYYETQPFDPKRIPPHLRPILEFKGDGESITDIGPEGFRIRQVQPTESDMLATMNPQNTAEHFIKYYPPVVLDVLHQFNLVAPHETISFGVIHDPSNFVSRMIARATAQLATKWEVTKEMAQHIFSAGFLLDQMKTSNTSGSTTPAKFQFLVDTGKIQPEGNFFLGAPGVGSTLAAATIKIK